KSVVIEIDAPTLKIDTLRSNPKGLHDLGLPAWNELDSLAAGPDLLVRRVLWPINHWRLTPRFWQKQQSAIREDADVPGYSPSQRDINDLPSMAPRRVADVEASMAMARPGMAER